eukprot:COSAG01_NODE_11151_length_1995_cov_16.477321_4_plen_78_part_00
MGNKRMITQQAVTTAQKGQLQRTRSKFRRRGVTGVFYGKSGSTEKTMETHAGNSSESDTDSVRAALRAAATPGPASQ